MPIPARFLATVPGIAMLGAAVLLAGCGDSKKPAKAEGDPALSGALGDQIMVDPDLAGQNQSGDGVTAGSNSVELPPEQRSPEAIAAAKAEALRLAGTIETAPAPQGSDDVPAMVEQTATAAQVAENAKADRVDCSGKAEYSASWANALPEPLKVYPRGAVQESAGTDKDGCRLRVVSFVTPVGADDVVNFYYTRVRKAGYDASHRLDGGDHVLGGRKAGAAYMVYVRGLENGLTEVDVVTGGG